MASFNMTIHASNVPSTSWEALLDIVSAARTSSPKPAPPSPASPSSRQQVIGLASSPTPIVVGKPISCPVPAHRSVSPKKAVRSSKGKGKAIVPSVTKTISKRDYAAKHRGKWSSTSSSGSSSSTGSCSTMICETDTAASAAAAAAAAAAADNFLTALADEKAKKYKGSKQAKKSKPVEAPKRKSARNAATEPATSPTTEPAPSMPPGLSNGIVNDAQVALRKQIATSHEVLATNISEGLAMRERSPKSLDAIFQLSAALIQIGALFEKATDEVIQGRITNKLVASDIFVVAQKWYTELILAAGEMTPSMGRLRSLLCSLSSKLDEYAATWIKVIKTGQVYLESNEMHALVEEDKCDYGQFIELWGELMEKASAEAGRRARWNTDDLWAALSQGVANAPSR